jgi:predicted Zn finger-like uncharacterized protein
MNGPDAPMIVTCPHCHTRYRLAASLLGPSGARVRCPRCHERFVVALTSVGVTDGPRHDGAAVAGAESSPGADVAVEFQPGPLPDEPAAGATVNHAPLPRPLPAATLPPHAEEARNLARAIVATLEERSGAALVAAHARGRLFSEAGGELLAAFDDYRRQAGARASPSAFLAALRDRLGIDLAPFGS